MIPFQCSRKRCHMYLKGPFRKVNDVLQEGLTQINHPTGKLKGPNKRLEVPQVANLHVFR